MDEVSEILTRLGRIEGKQDSAIKMNENLHTSIQTIDVRVRTLEKGHSRILGWGAGATGLLATLGAYIKLGGGS